VNIIGSLNVNHSFTFTITATNSTFTNRELASCPIYSYALTEYKNRFAVERMVTLFFTMLPSVKFTEEKVLVFFILREKMLK